MAETGIVDARIPRWMASTGLVGVGVSGIGLVAARFMPLPSPTMSGEQIAALLSEHGSATRFGICLIVIGFSLWGLWAACLVALTRQMEDGFPILTYGSLIMIPTSLMILVFSAVLWAVASFRPDSIAPDLTRLLNDAAWMMFVWPWPPFGVWFVLLGVAILKDDSASPIFPRWSAWSCFWLTFLIAPGSLVVFFKNGPLAWNGIIAFYIPIAAFLIWIVIMSVCMFKALGPAVLQQSATGDDMGDEALLLT